MDSLLVVGVSHKYAALEVRERLAFNKEQIPGFLQALVPGVRRTDEDPRAETALTEAALLSTCNRTEIYACAPDLAEAEKTIRRCLTGTANLPPQILDNLFYVLQGEEAVGHLLQVAAGLDSLILGENEILGQVRQAGEIALAAGSSGPILCALFRAAVQAGKRVRAGTDIGRAGRSVAAVVVELAEKNLGSLVNHTALIIGAGKISSITARALVDAGLTCVLVTNRTFDRAESMVKCIGGTTRARAVHFDALGEVLPEADIVICSTGAPHTVLHTPAVRAAMAARPDRPLLIADLAVPRDADPEIGDLPGVSLVDMDGLEGIVSDHHPFTVEARQAAEAIVTGEARVFNRWLSSRRAAPLIQALRLQAEAVCQAQVEQTLRRMGELSPHQEQLVRAMGEAIVGKLLHAPIQGLKEPPEDLAWQDYTNWIQDLYGIKIDGSETN